MRKLLIALLNMLSWMFAGLTMTLVGISGILTFRYPDLTDTQRFLHFWPIYAAQVLSMIAFVGLVTRRHYANPD